MSQAPTTIPSIVRFGDFELELRTGELRNGEKSIGLQEQCFQILTLLLENPGGGLVTREQLRQRLWPDGTVVDFEHSINAAIKRLREVLDDSADNPKYIETIPRRGYRLLIKINGSEGRQSRADVGSRLLADVGHPNHISEPADVGPAPAVRRQGVAAASLVLAVSALVTIAFVVRQSHPRAIAPQSGWVALTDFTDAAVQPAISPDGRMLAFVRGVNPFITVGQLYIKMLPDGEPRQLTHDQFLKFSPAFTPDGSRIVYTSIDARFSWNTYTVSVLGGDPQLHMRNAAGLRWIGDGRVLFSEIKKGVHMALVTSTESRAENRDIYVPPTERGMAHHSALSPDRQQVLITEMGSDAGWLPCRLVPFDGHSSGVQVGPKQGACRSVAWSHDGKWMYLSVDQGTGFHLWRQRTSESEPEQITFGPTEQEGIAVSSDGSLITSVGTLHSSLWLHEPGKEDREISVQGNSGDPRFSADGTRLYYLITAEKVGNLMMADLTSGGTESALPGFVVYDYDISPDGTRVLFQGRTTEGEPQLWLAPLDRRSPPRSIAFPVHVEAARFATDDQIYFRALENGKWWAQRSRLDGSARESVWPEPVVGPFNTLSPDRNWFLATYPASGERSTIEVIARKINGDGAVKICNLCWVWWSPDSATMYLYLYAAAGSGTRPSFVSLPTLPGSSFPALPPNGLTAETVVNMPGVKVLDTPTYPSPIKGVYAYLKQVAQRNIYRIPIQ